MKTSREYCPACQYRSFYDCLKQLRLSPEEEERLIRWYLKEAAERFDFTLTPGKNHFYSRPIHEYAGYDFYAGQKRKDNEEMLRYEEHAKKAVLAAKNGLEAAVRYAIAGNVIDPTAHHDITVEQALDAAAQKPLAIDDVELLRAALQKARSVLYVTDNCGELVFDKVFLWAMDALGLAPLSKFTVAVRGGPFANDAMMDDAAQVGLTEMVKVITTGSDLCTVYLPDMGEEFMEAYRACDLLITKGMGNYESVESFADKTVCMLLMAKCVPVANNLGARIGDFVCRVKNAELMR